MLEIQGLSVGYAKRTVLQNLSVSFELGKLTSIIGPNGSGKTTLIKAAAGLITPRTGTVTVGGKPLSAYKRNEVARQIAYLAQIHESVSMTVENLVLHGRFPYLHYPHSYSGEDRSMASAAMERVGISHLAEEPVATLSGGMRQAAYIAMALARNTPYILLDEPTTFLDVSHQIAIMELLRSLADENRCVVAVLHDLPLALSFSDHVAVLAEGQIAAQGTPPCIAQSGTMENVFGISITEDREGTFCCRLKK
ncbi:MAG: ABC transporter ATP-binding protein [Ruminococcaceae bacterium]|nr:ABC transporter ATP-binding protein [Oscillospiraceae bacterium]